MTQARATGPGPRTGALQVPARGGRISKTVRGGTIVLALAIVAAGCGSTASGSAGPAAASARPSVPVDALGSGGPAVPGGSPDGTPPPWPGTTVLAVIALGAADGEIQKAGNDLQAAAAAQDLRAMWGAADGLAKLTEGLLANVDRLDLLPATQPVAALYRKALPEIDAGARQLRDAITAGDSNGIVAGSQAIAAGLVDYGPIRAMIAPLVEQAILQQHLLVK